MENFSLFFEKYSNNLGLILSSKRDQLFCGERIEISKPPLVVRRETKHKKDMKEPAHAINRRGGGGIDILKVINGRGGREEGWWWMRVGTGGQGRNGG